MIEAELKAKIRSLEETEMRIIAAGFEKHDMLAEEDLYFNGNNRDFSKTDEALRLRTVRASGSGGEASVLTYKGPKLDGESQSRVELESEIADYDSMRSMLHALGYIPVIKVRKTRRLYKLDSVTACIDDVEGLGLFLELEKMVESDSLRETAIRQLKELLNILEIPEEDTSLLSYLELLMGNI